MPINLTPDLERAITDEARRLGTTPEAFIEWTLRQQIGKSGQSTEPSVPGEQRLQRLLSIVRNYGVSHTNESLSSEGLYE